MYVSRLHRTWDFQTVDASIVDVAEPRVCYVGCSRAVSKSVQVLFSAIEAAVVLLLMILN